MENIKLPIELTILQEPPTERQIQRDREKDDLWRPVFDLDWNRQYYQLMN